MKIGVKKTVEVEAKTLKLHLKVRDEFQGTLHDQDDEQIGEYEVYVPGFFPGYHYGDYLILDIDIDTGLITNWVKPAAKELQKTFLEKEEDD